MYDFVLMKITLIISIRHVYNHIVLTEIGGNVREFVLLQICMRVPNEVVENLDNLGK
jgi:hypothetical protein